ncbi:MAG: MFS transporter [Alphaproteobacteria bacterium]|nr:MFS transporter [Alphaproteobacteria bacterium]
MVSANKAGGRGTVERRVLVWMCVLVAVNQLGFGGIVPSLALYANSFGVSASAIGLAVAIYGLARFAVAAPSGHLSDRFGRRPTLALGGLVTAIGNLWCALATSFPEFVIARFVAGAGAGLIITTGHIVLADITTPERRGRTLAIYQGVFIFAVGIGPYPGGLLAEHFGLAAPFYAYTLSGLATGSLAWFAVAETRDLAGAHRPADGGPRPSFITQAKLLAGQVGFVLVCLVGLLKAVARTGGLFSIIPLFASLRLGLGVSEIGLGLALGTVIGLIVAYPTGMLVDYFGRKAVIVPAIFLGGASMLFFCWAPSFAWFVAACLVWGLASSVGSAAPAAYAADSAPPGANAATMSLYRMVGDAGYVAGPILLGLIADLYEPEAALILSAILLAIVGVLFALFAPETYRGRRAPPP